MAYFLNLPREQVPLVYPPIQGIQNTYKNILLIDSQVPDYQQMVDSVNSSTFPIVYSTSSSKTELLALLQTHFTSISRIGIAFTSELGNVKMFLDNKPFFKEEPFSENVQFIIDIIKEFSVTNIDYLACNTLNYPAWTNYYKLLALNTGVVVGASNDKTGNIKYGGDWTMESTGQDIEVIYFTKSIEYYTFLLDNPVLLQNFRVTYSNGVFVLLTLDVNNFYNCFLPPPYTGIPSWLVSFQLYYSGSLQYTLSNLNGLVFESNTSYPFNDPLNLQSSNGIAFWTTDTNVSPAFYNLMSINSLNLRNIQVSAVAFDTTPCFKEDSKILTSNGYIPIQDLRKGDLVKTLKHDYKPIDVIGRREIHHPALKERIKDQLYKCSQTEYPEIFEPLVITGCHSILVKNFISEEQKQKVIEVNGDIYVTDNKYRLPACADPRASVYEIVGNYTIYHLALENDDYYKNYGIYANGLLVETCSKRYLKELSNMTLIE